MKKHVKIKIKLLELKDAILSKEMINIRANRDLSEFGKWMCDYDSWIHECQDEIDRIKIELDNCCKSV